MRRALVLAPLLAAAAQAQVVTKQPDMSVVLTGERALMVLEPRLVAAGNVFNLSTSPSGRYLVAFQEVPSERPLEIGKQPPEPKAKNVVIWDSATGATRTVLLHRDVDPRQSIVQWFTGTDKALLQLYHHRVELPKPDEGVGPLITAHREWHILEAPSGQLRKVLDENDGVTVWSGFSMCPVTGMAATLKFIADEHQPPEHRFSRGVYFVGFLAANGTWIKDIKLATDLKGFGANEWSPDGRTFQLEAHKGPDQDRRFVPRVLQFDVARGTYTEVVGPVPVWQHTEKQLDLTLAQEGKVLEDFPTKRTLMTWWLKSAVPTETPQALVAEHASNATLPNGERFVAYTANGALFTRQIVEMPLDLYREMRAAAERSETISRAKQTALALLMYASDYDDTIPAGLNLDDVFPYHKNPRLLEGFVLVFPGGKLGDVREPAKTVLGYIDGPGGRAVLFVDGHVEWTKN